MAAQLVQELPDAGHLFGTHASRQQDGRPEGSLLPRAGAHSQKTCMSSSNDIVESKRNAVSSPPAGRGAGPATDGVHATLSAACCCWTQPGAAAPGSS